MKRLFVLYIITVLAIVACDFSASNNIFSDEADSLAIKRYDRLEYRFISSADYSALQKMNTEYSKETGMLIENILELGTVDDPDIYKKLYNYYQDSTLQTIMRDVEKEYANIDDLDSELRDAFQNLKSMLPDLEIPKFYTQIGALDQSIIVGDKSVCISLDKYLGSEYPLYKKYYDKDARKTMSREYIVPDCIVFYLLSLHTLPNFESSSQYNRDMHMGILMWIANKAVGKKVLQLPWVDKVEGFVASHPDITAKQLLEITDFSKVK